jgi:hypothetical protein
MSPLAIDAETFRALGHDLVDRIAALRDSFPQRPVTRDPWPWWKRTSTRSTVGGAVDAQLRPKVPNLPAAEL